MRPSAHESVRGGRALPRSRARSQTSSVHWWGGQLRPTRAFRIQTFCAAFIAVRTPSYDVLVQRRSAVPLPALHATGTQLQACSKKLKRYPCFFCYFCFSGISRSSKAVSTEYRPPSSETSVRMNTPIFGIFSRIDYFLSRIYTF